LLVYVNVIPNLLNIYKASEAKWLIDKDNTDIQRRGQGSGLRIAVMGIPITRGSVTVSTKRQLGASHALSCEAEVNQAMKRMRFGAFDASLSAEAFGQVGGAAFGNGAASCGTAAAASSAQAVLPDIDVVPFHFSALEKAANLTMAIAEEGSGDEGAAPSVRSALQMSPRSARC
jgi:hypothetical protein